MQLWQILRFDIGGSLLTEGQDQIRFFEVIVFHPELNNSAILKAQRWLSAHRERRASVAELASQTDAGALAKFFVATIQGMRAMPRLKSDRRALRQVARITLAVFDR